MTEQDCNIRTPRLRLRHFREEDAPAVVKITTSPSVAHFCSDMIYPDLPAAREWIAWINRCYTVKVPFAILAMESLEGDACVGYIGIHAKAEIEGEVEIMFAVADAYQGAGYATEAGKAMMAWAFANCGIETLVAIVKPDNLASQRVIAKLGFQESGDRMVWYDGAEVLFHYYRLHRPK